MDAATPIPRPPGDVDAPIDLPRVTGLQLRVFIACALVLFCDGYDMQSLALAVPSLITQFGVTANDFSLALSASLFGMAIGGAVFAPLGDRIGRKPMLVAAMICLGASTLGALLIPSTLWIALCRLFTGIGLGIAGVNAAALSGEYAPARWRFLIMTVLTCFVPLGAFLGAMTAPAIIDALTWRGIFYVGGFGPILIGCIALLLTAESLKWLLLRRPADPRIAVIARQLAPTLDPAELTVSTDQGATRQSVFGLLMPAHRIRTLVVWLSVGSGAFSLYLMMSWLPTMLKEAHWSSADALRGTAAVQLGGIFSSLLMAWAIDRRKLLPAVLCGYGCALLAFLAIGLLPGSVLGWQMLLVLAGAGTSGMQAVWMAIAVVLYPLELRATSAGWLSCVSRIGAVAAPFAGGAALAAGVEPRHMLLGLVVPVGISILAILLARRHFVPPPAVILTGEAP
ncbi:MFS transporter [Sphingobium nicotianae]|nr:MFS transporter [Sphingobium nicotianae]